MHMSSALEKAPTYVFCTFKQYRHEHCSFMIIVMIQLMVSTSEGPEPYQAWRQRTASLRTTRFLSSKAADSAFNTC